jgi:uncharacterized membrane protein YbaN (DUF454 family)
MRFVAFALPIAVAGLLAVGVLITGIAHLGLFSSAAGLLFSLYAARFLHRRSKNLEAVFFSTRVRPSDSEDHKFQCELGALMGAAVVVAATAWLVFVGR